MKNQKNFYGPAERPPLMLTIFSSIQHMLLVLSLGLALPVTVARAANLTPTESGVLLSISLLSIGITGILQTLPSRFFGNGRMDLSGSDSAALSACAFAAQLGGMPLVFGMTLISGIFKGIVGSFTYRFRKLFPAEVTGTMIFILGLSIIPTAIKFFLGVPNFDKTGTYSVPHLIVAIITFLVMLVCTGFFEKTKPYAVLFGIIVGYILSACLGIFDKAAFAELSNSPFFQLPIPKKISLAFDWRAVIPFAIVTIAAIVDNIGDFTAAQKISDPKYKRPDWKCIESGIRASGLGSAIAGILGGVIQSTATANLGIAKATGITSRIVGYGACGILIALAFFPKLTGALMLIPEPVLGAILLYSVTYIMAGGFSSLMEVELDDRKVFVVFVSIILSVSTMIPGLWKFLPPNVAQVICSPLVMGTVVLITMTLLTRIGTKRKVCLQSGTCASAILVLNEKLKEICKEWTVKKDLSHSLIFGIDAVAEGLYVNGIRDEIRINMVYDQMQIKIQILTHNAENLEESNTVSDKKGVPDELELALIMLKNRFDHVRWIRKGQQLSLNIDADL